jgi:hypothetical protein
LTPLLEYATWNSIFEVTLTDRTSAKNVQKKTLSLIVKDMLDTPETPISQNNYIFM